MSKTATDKNAQPLKIGDNVHVMARVHALRDDGSLIIELVERNPDGSQRRLDAFGKQVELCRNFDRVPLRTREECDAEARPNVTGESADVSTNPDGSVRSVHLLDPKPNTADDNYRGDIEDATNPVVDPDSLNADDMTAKELDEATRPV